VTELLLNVAAVPALIGIRVAVTESRRDEDRVMGCGRGLSGDRARGFALSEPRNLFENFEQHYSIGGKAVLDAPTPLGSPIESGLEDGLTNLPIIASRGRHPSLVRVGI